ncbi:hypothetical protein F53441_13713 [Fusarium austroafricanum]|uniref:Uncharacterized protein n=1 Tax=Fusarium austroafricanum TaxID=2364996 RepID=A0A8H4NEB7_9HYPO|nr:hypothetical protein F53441_13713 [Fusarium austroafricanum]
MPTLLPSVGATSDDVRPLSNGDNLNDNGHPADDPQNKEGETYPALVLGKEMLVPRTCDADTYDPDAQMPWTPEPEPYDPETYSAWGRKHFGEEWYHLRKAMLEERIPYHKYEPVYMGRQRALRVIEHQAEGRPFRPYSEFVGNNLEDEGWERLWARMSNNELGFPRSPSPSPPPPPPLPPPPNDSDSSESGEPTPMPTNLWEQIEYKRTHWHLTEENYQFERFFLREEIIDRARSRHENGPGNRQAREKRELMNSFRYVDPPRFYIEQDNIQDHIDLPKKGWMREEIVAVYEARVAMLEWPRMNPAPRGNGIFDENITPEEEAALASWRQEYRDASNRFYGSQGPELPANTKDYGAAWDLWLKGTYARISRQRQREVLRSDATGDATSRAEELQRIEDEEQRDREALERAIKRSIELTEKSERISRLPPPQTQEEMNHRFRVWDELDIPLELQNDRARKYGFGERAVGREVPQPPATAPRAGAIGDAPGTHMREAVAQSSATTPQLAKGTRRKTCGDRITKNTLTHAEASPRTGPQRHNRQRKTYKKERASRRLAKLEPEYGMLEDARRT